MAESDEVDTCSPTNSPDMNAEPKCMDETSVENRSDEYLDDNSDKDDSACISRSERASKTCDCSNHLPTTDHTQIGTTEGQWLKPHYYEEL